MNLIDIWRMARVFVILVVTELFMIIVLFGIAEFTSWSYDWLPSLLLAGGFGPVTMLLFRFRILVAEARIRHIMVGTTWVLGLALPYVIYLFGSSSWDAEIRDYYRVGILVLLSLAAIMVLWLSALGILTAVPTIFAQHRTGPQLAQIRTTIAEDFHDRFIDDAEPKVVRLATRLYKESESMRRMSIQTLTTVGALITLAALVVLFAGFITTIDIRSASVVRKAQEYLNNAYENEFLVREPLELAEAIADGTFDSDTGELHNAYRRLEFLLRRRTASLPGNFDVPYRRTFTELIYEGGADYETRRNLAKKVAEDLREDVEQATQTRRKMERLMFTAQLVDIFGKRPVMQMDDAVLSDMATPPDVPTSPDVGIPPDVATPPDVGIPPGEAAPSQIVVHSDDATEALIAAGVTRFGIVILILFLAQALINLYRYALRLSAFYRIRALILILTGGDTIQMQEAVKSLSSDHLNLGREPRSPVDDIAKLAETIKNIK